MSQWTENQKAKQLATRCCKQPLLSLTRKTANSVIYTCTNCLQQTEMDLN